MNKILTIVISGLIIFGMIPSISAAEKKDAKKDALANEARQAAKDTKRPPVMFIPGTITKINNKNPEKIILEVKNERDGQMSTISVVPKTTVTKITDPSELKAGDTVRIMTRKTDNDTVAVGIIFGKIKPFPVIPPPPITKTPNTQPAKK